MGEKPTPPLVIDGTRDDLDGRTTSIIRKKHGVKFYPAEYARPTTALIASSILGLPLLVFAVYLTYVMLTHEEDVGSKIFFGVLIAACLWGCWACARWIPQQKTRPEKTSRRADGRILHRT